MKTLQIVTIVILIILSASTHIKYHQSPQSYLSLLKSQQKSVTDLLSSLKAQISQSQQKLGSETDILNKINILQQSILRQKAQLSTLAKTTNIPLNESSWTCSQLIDTSQGELALMANSVVQTTNQLDNSVKNLQNSTTVNYLTPDSNAAVTAAQQIQRMIAATGTQTNQFTTSPQTNWMATSWVTGNKTIQQIEQQAQQKDSSNSYVTVCPLLTPFFDGSRCIACPLDAPYFNVQTRKCVNCQIFDATTHSCKSSTPPPINPIPVNYNSTNFSSGLNRTILPSNFPIQSLTNPNGIVCPSDRPFYSRSGCTQCQTPTPLFNYSSQECTTCPAGTTYVASKYACLGPNQVNVTNLPIAQNRLILPQGTTITDLQKQQQALSQNQTIVSCPSTLPFFNGRNCLNCDNNQFFNVQTLACQSCPANSAYNSSIHRCVSVTFYSNLTNKNWTSTNPQKVQQTTLNSSLIPGAIACPADRPFFNGASCISCPSGQLFNFDVKQCESCPAGTTFSANQHSCVTAEQGLYQTNPDTTPNLIYDGTSKGQWMTIYMQNQQNFPGIIDCPKDRPYYDGIRCINCPSAYPYFNLRKKICQVCDSTSKYDTSIHECLSEKGDIITQNPNIQKMVASIFT